MAKLILWNKLGSVYQVEHSEVGPNGTRANNEFLPGKYDNGSDFDAINEYAKFNITSVLQDPNILTIEYWIKTDFDVVNGVPSFTTGGTNYFFRLTDEVSAAIDILFGATGHRVIWYSGSAVSVYDTTSNWNAGDIIHVAYIFDRTANFDENKTIAVYVNGMEVASSISDLGDGSGFSSYIAHIGGRAITNDRTANSVIDNIKIYDYVKTDFSDRFWEGYPPVRSGVFHQFVQKDQAPRIYEVANYLSGREVEVPEPEHWWKLNEKSGDKVTDHGTDPLHGINNNMLINKEDGYYKDNDDNRNILIASNGTGLFDVQEFSVGGWVKKSTGEIYGILFSYDFTSHVDPWYAIHLRVRYGASADAITFGWNSGGAGNAHTIIAEMPEYTDDRWVHVFATYKSGEQKLYIDGILVAEDGISGTITFYAQEVWIGQANFVTTNGDCYLKNIRFYESFLTPAQVKIVYEQELAEIIEGDIPTPDHRYPLDSLVIADKGKGSLILPNHYYALDETEQTAKALDGGTDPANATINNGVTPVSGKYGGAFQLNGTNQYLESTLNITKSFTAACWAKSDAVNWNGNAFLLSSRSNNGFIIHPDISTKTVTWYIANSSGGFTALGAITMDDITKWHHYVMVWDDSGKGYGYVDGELTNTYTGSITRTDGSITLDIGKNHTAANYLDGTMDDCKIFDRALSQQEVINVLNNTDPRRLAYGTLSATPPTLIYDSEMGECLEFNGSSNHIDLAQALIDLDKNDIFEISAWFKSSGSTCAIIGKMNNAGVFEGWEFGFHPGKLYLILSNNWGTNAIGVYTNNSFNDGNWHHAITTYNGSSKASGIKIYIDGSREGTYIDRDNLSATIINTVACSIGSRNKAIQFMNGRLKDIRIWKK